LKLAVFDIDGTLADTCKIDAECFARAVADQFNITEINLEWSTYVNVTDSGILHSLYRENSGKLPTQPDIVRLKERFLHHLQNAFRADSTSFREIPGASIIIDRLTRHPNWSIAYATGSWHDSAIFKLQSARLPVHHISLSSSDDAIEREAIVNLAINRAREMCSTTHFERTVLIGDGLWDARTAISLVLPFIGVGQQDHFDYFENISVIPDFVDGDHFFHLLESASVPQRSTSHAHFA